MLKYNINQYEKELLKCKYYPEYFIPNYCYSIDNEDQSIKLIPDYPYIKATIKAIHLDQNNLIEKSRRMLVSWLTQAYNIWGLTFGVGYLGLNLSRKEDYVDNKNVNSLFGKMRFIFNRLPEWMVECQFGEYRNADYYIRYLNAENKKRNNNVMGESANTDAGRGGGYSKIFADEFGFVAKSETVYAAFSSACKNGKNLVTTPPYAGKKCCFYRLREDSIIKKNNFNLISLHWSKHPERDRQWYKEESSDKTEDEIARELDIDWNVSTKGRIYDKWNSENHVIDYKYQPELPLFIDFDFGIGESPVSIGISQDLTDGSIVYIDDDEYYKHTVVEVIPKLLDKLHKISYINNIAFIQNIHNIVSRETDLDKRKIELIACIKNDTKILRKLKELKCYGDPAGKAKGATGKSWISEFYDFSFDIDYTTSGKKRDLEYGHLLVNQIIVNNKLLCTSDCTVTIDSLENYKRKTDSEGNVLESMIVSDDFAKHRCDGIRYKIINTRDKDNFDEDMLNNLPPGI